MSWLSKLLPPKIKREHGAQRRGALPEGLWSKCPSCEAVLYATDLDNNQQVCPKCGHHNRLNARQRLELLLDPEACFEIGAEILPVDSLKFKDSKRYPDRLMEANESSGESDSLVCLQGSIKNIRSLPPPLSLVLWADRWVPSSVSVLSVASRRRSN
jgi:acetyl-CoA carboxylase carboxyl transferase subunit beta